MNMVSPDFSEVAPTIVREKAKEMLTVTRNGAQTIVRINSSSLGIILSCPRKSYYTLHRGLKSRSEAPALLFGTAIHKALEVFYSHPRAERTIPVDFKQVSDLMAFEDWENKPLPSAHFLYQAIAAFVTAASLLKHLPSTDKRSIPNGIWILQEYFKSYINDPYIVARDENGPITERTAECVLHEDATLKVIIFGTIDVILQNESTGMVLPADHKTSSVVGADFFNRLKPNHQYTGYLLLAQKVLGLKTDEFLVNCLQVKPRPLTARGAGPHFTRQVTRRSEHDMAEFKDSVMEAVGNYLRWSASEKWPLGHVDACTMWGGCQFLEVCSAPSQLRENLVEAKFQTELPTNV